MNWNFPSKWKDTVDLNSIIFQKIKILEVLGYPHAANQVFAVRGLLDGAEKTFIIKYKGHVESNIQNEVNVLSQIDADFVPKIVEYDHDFTYLVTEAIEGEKLSTIVGENTNCQSLAYMYKFGRMLATLHDFKGSFGNAPHRRFEDLPNEEYFYKTKLHSIFPYLIANKPANVNKCFVHGDFHYANVLWKNQQISAVLDFELSGIGNKEFDVAWFMILRPGQKFMKSERELKEFLNGYMSTGNCNLEYVKYYMALIYARFIQFGVDEYEDFIRKWYKDNLLT